MPSASPRGVAILGSTLIGALLLAAIPSATDAAAAAQSPAPLATRALDCLLTDSSGQARSLGEIADRRLVVVAFLGVDCPLAQLYAPRLSELAERYRESEVQVIGVNANAGDGPAEVSDFARRFDCRFPIYKDADQRLADALGATRQLEVFLLNERRAVAYHGRVDDQHAPNLRRAAPRRHDLATAIDEVLAGAPVSTPETPVAGCLLDRGPSAASATDVTYARHIAPLFARHCVECHQPGRIAPFSLLSYDDATAWAATAQERVDSGAMPPWHADPEFGRFANERRLDDDEKHLLGAWISAGMPRGDDAASPPPPAPGSVSVSARETKHPATVNPWRIGQPDQIISLPAPVPIPAHGVIDYVNVEVDPGFTKDVWVRGAEVRPGVVQALHHCTVMIAPGSRAGEKNSHDGPTPEVSFLAGYVPGLTASLMPPGMARRIPAGWHIYFQLHYVSTGVALTDQTSLGLVFSEPAQHAVRTNILHRDDLQLRPYDANQRFEQTWNVPADMLLLAMLPHMHLRGSSFRYEALYPDGRSEVLLSVPKFDMMWQHHYVLAEPKLLPAGAVLRAVATYDNSPANPRNPDPSATVRVGPQSTDEMFNGWFDVAEIEPPRRVLPIAWAAVGVVALWAIDRRRRGKTAA